MPLHFLRRAKGRTGGIQKHQSYSANCGTCRNRFKTAKTKKQRFGINVGISMIDTVGCGSLSLSYTHNTNSQRHHHAQTLPWLPPCKLHIAPAWIQPSSVKKKIIIQPSKSEALIGFTKRFTNLNTSHPGLREMFRGVTQNGRFLQTGEWEKKSLGKDTGLYQVRSFSFRGKSKGVL